jgi:hypothetical protein
VSSSHLDRLHNQIPGTIPEFPILFVATSEDEPYWLSEIDVMLLSQELDWPTLNGYSGNFAPGYEPANSCKQLPSQIKSYMYYAGISSPSFYLGIFKRVGLIGFQDCEPGRWKNIPY